MRVSESCGNLGIILLLGFGFSGCEEAAMEHPWLDLSGTPEAQVIEVSGASQGQLVIVLPAGTSFEEVMALGERIAGQVPMDATVNARIFDDLETARAWRTAPAEWTLQHLLAVVAGGPETGRAEVRWVGPEARMPPSEPAIVAPGDSF